MMMWTAVTTSVACRNQRVLTRSASLILKLPGSTLDSRQLSSSSGIGHLEKKKADKERRRQQYETRVKRQENLKTRRAGKPRYEKRNTFKSWFVKKKVDEEYMNRKARQAGLDWEIHAAVILERSNVVMPDMEDWEIEYDQLYAHLCQYGIQYPSEFMEVDENMKFPITNEEVLQNLPKGYVPAPRETEADRTGDVRTSNRKLKTSIYLVVEENGKWQFPTVALHDDETILEGAKRAIVEKLGDNVEYWSISNCPCAVDMVAFDKPLNGMYGSKTFFMKLGYDGGEANISAGVKDFAWLDRGEMTDRAREGEGERKASFYHYLL